MSPPDMAGWNLALRFALEVAALTGLATGAWRLSTGPWRWVAVIAVPLLAAVAWTTFNVPDDPSRSGAAPIQVTGGTRLTLELAILGAGSAGFLLRGPRAAGLALLALVMVHYVNSIPRLDWLLNTRPLQARRVRRRNSTSLTQLRSKVPGPHNPPP